MSELCQTNCGSEIKVFGCKYCPECYQKYNAARTVLEWRPVGEIPSHNDHGEEFLLLNQCDGYHLAFAQSYRDSDEFDGFYSFDLKQEFTPDFYVAWAKLPDAVKDLHPTFVAV